MVSVIPKRQAEGKTGISPPALTTKPMAEIAPIRPLDEAAALDWLRSQPGGRTKLSAAELGRRWGWHRQRAGRRLKAWQKSGLVTRRGNTVAVADGSPVTPPKAEPVTRAVTRGARATRRAHGAHTAPVTPSAAGIDVTAYIAALALAGVAAYFSIRGMTVLFPGAPLAIVAMAAAMEIGKLATAAWLARHWRASSWMVRNVFAGLVLIIAAINAAGVYSQLVAAHVGEHRAAISAVDVQAAALDARIEVQAHAVADLDARVTQIDGAIAEATKRGKTTAAMGIVEAQRQSRAALVGERQREAGTFGGPPGGTRLRGRQGQGGGIGSSADPIRGRRLWRHGPRSGNPVADPAHGADVRPARHRIDGRGFGPTCLVTGRGVRPLTNRKRYLN
jgi:MarR family protein